MQKPDIPHCPKSISHAAPTGVSVSASGVPASRPASNAPPSITAPSKTIASRAAPSVRPPSKMVASGTPLSRAPASGTPASTPQIDVPPSGRMQTSPSLQNGFVQQLLLPRVVHWTGEQLSVLGQSQSTKHSGTTQLATQLPLKQDQMPISSGSHSGGPPNAAKQSAAEKHSGVMPLSLGPVSGRPASGKPASRLPPSKIP